MYKTNMVKISPSSTGPCPVPDRCSKRARQEQTYSVTYRDKSNDASKKLENRQSDKTDTQIGRQKEKKLGYKSDRQTTMHALCF